jgi:hypothetical protein
MNALEKLTTLTGQDRSVRLLNWGYGTWSAAYDMQDRKSKIEIKLEVTGDTAEEAIERIYARVIQAQKGIPEIAGPMLTHQPEMKPVEDDDEIPL